MTDSQYSPPGPFSTVDTVARRNALLLPDTHKQEVKNSIISLRSDFERLAVRYSDNRFDGPGGTFETYTADTFNQFTCNGLTSTQEVLLEGQVSPWPALGTSSDFILNLDVNGYYVITIAFEIRYPSSADSEILFQLRDSTGNGIVAGSQPVEELLVNQWFNVQTIIYFVPLDYSAATSGQYIIEGRPKGNDVQIGKRAITVHKMMDGPPVGAAPAPPPPEIPVLPPEFIFTVDTTLSAQTASDTIRINATAAGVDYDIAWGDGQFSLNVNGIQTHTYSVGGVYQIQLAKLLSDFEFGTANDAPKVISIDNWGDSAWMALGDACQGCTNLTNVTSNPPDLSNGPSLNQMFRRCSLLLASGINVSRWLIESVVIANGMWRQCTLLDLDISAWGPTLLTGGATMMTDSAFGTVNYDKMLISWNAKPHVVGVVNFGAGNACYSVGAATTAHDTLDGEGWVFSDNGQCP